MVFTEQDVKQLLREALEQAQSAPDTGKTNQEINHASNDKHNKRPATGYPAAGLLPEYY